MGRHHSALQCPRAHVSAKPSPLQPPRSGPRHLRLPSRFAVGPAQFRDGRSTRNGPEGTTRHAGTRPRFPGRKARRLCLAARAGWRPVSLIRPRPSRGWGGGVWRALGDGQRPGFGRRPCWRRQMPSAIYAPRGSRQACGKADGWGPRFRPIAPKRPPAPRLDRSRAGALDLRWAPPSAKTSAAPALPPSRPVMSASARASRVPSARAARSARTRWHYR